MQSVPFIIVSFVNSLSAPFDFTILLTHHVKPVFCICEIPIVPIVL